MTSKLKCPFCGAELQETFGAYMCRHTGCKICCCVLPTCMIEALTQAKQDLEIATKALKEIDTTRCIPQQTLISLGKFSKTTRFNAGNIICVATPDYIHNTLEQITHDNKD